jgi:hypothetical protein
MYMKTRTGFSIICLVLAVAYVIGGIVSGIGEAIVIANIFLAASFIINAGEKDL